jgi:NTP pyrophosphatase (non-canonical NTP hydrolase)
MQGKIGAWSRETFPLSSPNSTMRHLWSEMAELDKAVERKSSPEVSEEAADIFILLVQLCNLMQIDLGASVILKHEENLTRDWLPPNGDGVVFHKKGGEKRCRFHHEISR